MTNLDTKALLINNCKEIEQEIWDEYVDSNEKCEPIIDSIVNVDNFLASDFQIPWILKEPYDDEDGRLAAGGGWHFGNDFLFPEGFHKRMGRSRSTWHPITYVSYGHFKQVS